MIIVTTQCFPPATGGIETLMRALCAGLVDRGHELCVFADGGAPDDLAHDLSCGYPVYRYRGWKPWRRRAKARHIRQFGSTRHVRAVLADSWKSLEFLDARPYPAVACLAHGSEVPAAGSARKTARVRAALGKATAVIANSRFTADRIAPCFARSDRLYVVHPGVAAPPAPGPASMEAAARHLIGGRSPVLISVARLEPRKGHQRVLDILPSLLPHYPGLVYVVVGDGSQAHRLRHQAMATGLSAHVVFTGTVDPELKHALLLQSDLFVLPGSPLGDDVEGFGIAFIEAASCGVPAVAGRGGGAGEAVLDGETGLLCRGDDARALHAAVLRLLQDEQLRGKLGEQARHRAADLSWDRVISRYEELLLA